MSIKEGDTFNSLQEFKASLRRWAISENWTPHILDSDKFRVRAGCRSASGCPFRIRANFNATKRRVLITTCISRHTCFQFRDHENPLHQNIKRSETGKLKFLLEEVPRLLEVNTDTHVQEIVNVIEQKFGQKIPIRQAQKVKTALTPRILGPCRECRQIGHTRRHCPQREQSTTVNDVHLSIDEDARQAANGLHSTGEDHQNIADGDTLQDVPATGAIITDLEERQRRHATSSHSSCDSAIATACAASSDRLQPSPNSVSPGLVHAEEPQSTVTAAETRLKASELMHRAASLMEEAAKLNFEAARLMHR